MNNIKWILLTILFVGFFNCCKDEEAEPATTEITADFESGNIGEIISLSNNEWEFYLKNDNENPELSDLWRNWWHVKMENVAVDAPTVITLKNRGWPYYYLPVYSYDQINWQQFSEEEVTQNEADELIISKQFESSTVSIARFYPYTFSDLENYINSIEGNQYVDVQTPGYSQDEKPIYLLKITDTAVSVTNKKRIFMHARTHPGETPPSFLIEGIVNALLSGSTEAAELLSYFEFYIFPMQNVDGVVEGNYRTTPLSENLESMWYYDSSDPLILDSSSPVEVNVIHDYAIGLMNDGGPAISMALNLHASNSEEDTCPFFFPHFGTEAQGYSTTEASLWNQQITLIASLAERYGQDMLEPVTDEGGNSFASKTYPESWWWVNYSDQVLAMTMEMTYGRSGYAPRWIEPDDLRDLGNSLVYSIGDYYDDTLTPTLMTLKSKNDLLLRNLKYPELYPPLASDELKE
jgi:hypothetical protein